jgi:hypothetical protein
MRRTDALVVVLLAIGLCAPAGSSAQTKPPAATKKAPPAKRAPARPSKPAAPSELSREQMQDFLLTAEIISSRDIGTGVTRPRRLTLTKNGFTHDAAFQSVNARKPSENVGGGKTELNFVDAYRYNLAAYAVAGVLRLDHMMPVHVERTWKGEAGSLSWWVDNAMNESERIQKKIEPPDPLAWINQRQRMLVFAALVGDTDRNTGNVLITPNWTLLMIDFSRAFRTRSELPNEKDLGRIDKGLLTRLEALEASAVTTAVGKHLTKEEIAAVMARRDRLVKHYRTLIAQKGEAAILY